MIYYYIYYYHSCQQHWCLGHTFHLCFGYSDLSTLKGKPIVQSSDLSTLLEIHRAILRLVDFERQTQCAIAMLTLLGQHRAEWIWSCAQCTCVCCFKLTIINLRNTCWICLNMTKLWTILKKSEFRQQCHKQRTNLGPKCGDAEWPFRCLDLNTSNNNCKSKTIGSQ